MRNLLATAAVALPLAALPVAAQQQPAAPPLEVGAVAPDFAMPGATRTACSRTPPALGLQRKTVLFWPSSAPGRVAERFKCTRTVISTRSSSTKDGTWC
jgi:hypothetical protein